MADSTPNSLSPQGEHAPGAEPLSPAAQAVDDAFWKTIDGKWNIYDRRRAQLAATLRALADQVVPAEQHPPRRGMRPGGTGALSPDEGAEDQRATTRRQIIAIATELEATS